MTVTDEMVEAAARAEFLVNRADDGADKYGMWTAAKAENSIEYQLSMKGARAALEAAYPLVVAECAAVASSRKGNPNATWDGGDWWDGACENVADAILALAHAQQETATDDR